MAHGNHRVYGSCCALMSTSPSILTISVWARAFKLDRQLAFAMLESIEAVCGGSVSPVKPNDGGYRHVLVES